MCKEQDGHTAKAVNILLSEGQGRGEQCFVHFPISLMYKQKAISDVALTYLEGNLKFGTDLESKQRLWQDTWGIREFVILFHQVWKNTLDRH